MTDITELAQRLNICAKEGTYPVLSPADCGALVEALEKAQQLATQQGNIACALFDEVTAQRQRIAELESRTVKIPGWFVKDAIAVYDRDEIEEALSAAGIKWEAE